MKHILNIFSNLFFRKNRNSIQKTNTNYTNKEKIAFDLFREDEIKSSYEHFKKHFPNIVFLDKKKIREFSICKAIENHQDNYNYLEFGVYKGDSINTFAKHLSKVNGKIYGFDSFEGLNEDWLGTRMTKNFFDAGGQIPEVEKNCILIKGKIQNTLEEFLLKNQNLKINFLHMDLDTYPSTKYALSKLKNYLVNNAIILFDELYNMEGWKSGEYKALTEVFREEEYTFLSFSSDREQVVIQFSKK